MNTFFVLSCLLLVACVCGGPVTKCTAKDSKCIKDSAQAILVKFAGGIPELNVQKLDPLALREVIDASSNNLKLTVTDMVVTGLKGCVVKKIERDTSKSKLFTSLLCTVHAEGNYEMDGRLLILPIQGKGKAQVTLNKMQIDVMSAVSDRAGRDGKKHWHVKSFRYSYELKDKAFLKFENLFNGNALLARAAESIIDSSPNEIITEIGNPIIKRIVDKIVEEVNHFYKALPVEELALD